MDNTLTLDRWLVIAGIAAATVIGVANVVATLVANRTSDEASAFVKSLAAKTIEWVIPTLALVGGLLVANGRLRYGLFVFIAAASIYIVRFLARSGPATRIETVLVALHLTVVAWLSLADLLSNLAITLSAVIK